MRRAAWGSTRRGRGAARRVYRQEAHQRVVALEAARARRPELGARRREQPGELAPVGPRVGDARRRAARGREQPALQDRVEVHHQLEAAAAQLAQEAPGRAHRAPELTAAQRRAELLARELQHLVDPGLRAQQARRGRAPPARRAASRGRPREAPKRPGACAPRRRRRRDGPPGCDRRPAGSASGFRQRTIAHLAAGGSTLALTSRRGVDLWGWAGRILAHAAAPHPHPLRRPRGAAVRSARLPRRRRDPVHPERAAAARRLRLRGARDPRRAGHLGRPRADALGLRRARRVPVRRAGRGGPPLRRLRAHRDARARREPRPVLGALLRARPRWSPR